MPKGHAHYHQFREAGRLQGVDRRSSELEQVGHYRVPRAFSGCLPAIRQCALTPLHDRGQGGKREGGALTNLIEIDEVKDAISDQRTNFCRGKTHDWLLPPILGEQMSCRCQQIGIHVCS